MSGMRMAFSERTYEIWDFCTTSAVYVGFFFCVVLAGIWIWYGHCSFLRNGLGRRLRCYDLERALYWIWPSEELYSVAGKESSYGARHVVVGVFATVV